MNHNSENGYQINLNGIEFINNGGYRKKSQEIKYKKLWEVLKLIAITTNAIILLFFAYSTFIKDKKSKYKSKYSTIKISLYEKSYYFLLPIWLLLKQMKH